MSDLTDETFDEYAAQNYRNPNCVSVLEFIDDLKKIKYIKRLINKFIERGELKERLVLNHIIFLSNVFGVEATVRMLRFKLEVGQHPYLNSFFVYLDYLDPKDYSLYDLDLYEQIQRSVQQ
jgi:hypothetical protein